MSKSDKPELLIDWIYRGTFKKPRDPELRQRLIAARRCVLSDDMAAFLYTLMIEIYSGGKGGPHWRRRCCRRLDDCRHFSRLPHRVTWVEYSLAAMLQREIETKAKHSDDVLSPYSSVNDSDLTHAKSRRSRVGWLFRQHDKIETAFCADYFLGGIGVDSEPRWSQAAMSVVWCTENDPLPLWDGELVEPSTLMFPPGAESGLSQSEYVTGVKDYDRPNVAMMFHRKRPGRDADLAQGRARMMWCFLSTFNKVPIVGQHTVVPSHGFVARGSYHRFLEHKIITINVPEKAGIRKVARDAISIIRRRAHQVRGHWRDDSRLQKGNKRLWIAEHQRGDASIGFVTHDYSVQHERERGQDESDSRSQGSQ